MKPFDFKIDNGKISHIFDNRYNGEVDITNGKGTFGCVCYTDRSEDVNTQPKDNYKPHSQKFSNPSVVDVTDEMILLADRANNVTCRVLSLDTAIKIEWEYQNSTFSKFGAYLPLNFISQKNGEWYEQFLISSPNYNKDTKCITCMFTRPDGNHLMLVVSSQSSAFRIDYSAQSLGHFFDGFEIIANLDHSYGDAPIDNAKITAYLAPVGSYDEGMQFASDLLKTPYAKYEVSSCIIGEKIKVSIEGQCDEIEVVSPSDKVSKFTNKKEFLLPTNEYGFYKVTPFFKGKQGIGCVCFAHNDWRQMFKDSVLSVPVHKDKIIGTKLDGTKVFMPPYVEYDGYIDTNLCEHSMWAWAQLRYMQHYEIDKQCVENIENFLNIVLPDNPSIYRERQSIIPKEQILPHKMCAYNTYKSDRIQEALTGANIMLDFWRYYKDERFLETAINITDTIMSVNMKNGCIYKNIYNEKLRDYTTVTPLVFPAVDLYVELTKNGDIRAEKFKSYAEKIADFLVRRDMDFPTETVDSDLYNREFSDGAMSSSAVTVLYVSHFVTCKPEYIKYAEKLMKYHDAWCIYVYNAPMFHSSLRWWENLWEGDADGPALNCGHAWTVFRAEAEFWLGLINKDDSRMLSSYNAFMTNFAKQDKEGNMYTFYQCEPCISGNNKEAKEIDRRFAVGFPKKKDTTLSRYAYARAYDTWFSASAIIGETLLNAKVINGVIYSLAPFLKYLYISGDFKEIKFSICNEVEIFTKNDLDIIKGEVVKNTQFGFIIKPDKDGVVLLKNRS